MAHGGTKRPNTTSGGTTVVNNVSYNAANQLLTIGYNTTATETRTYNVLNQLITLTVPSYYDGVWEGVTYDYNYPTGTNNGKMQEFITPGILFGKLKLHPDDPKSRPGLTFGGGMQIATSQFHTYNHEVVLTARWIY